MQLPDRMLCAENRTGQHHNGHSRPLTFLVPVDFSANAYDTVTYALRLAQASDAHLHLVHVADLTDVPVSDNPFVMASRVCRMERHSRNCLTALMEIIQETGVQARSHGVLIGNVDALLQRHVESLTPDLVFIGRSCYEKRTIDRLLRVASCPVITVPPGTALTPPVHVGWDLSGMEPLPDVSEQMRRIGAGRLTLLNPPRKKGRIPLKVCVPFRFPEVQIAFDTQTGSKHRQSLQAFVTRSGIDLLCITTMNGLFSRRRLPAALHRIDVPVMIVASNGKSAFWPAKIGRLTLRA